MEDLERIHRTNHADLALLKPSSWPTEGAGPPPQLQGFTNFFVPASDDLQPGDAILVIGHGGKKLHYAVLTWLDWMSINALLHMPAH